MISAPVSGIGSTLFRFLTTRTAPPIKLRNSHFRPPGNYVGASFSIMASAGADDRSAAQFQLTPSSLLKILKGDITQWSVDGSSDAIVTISLFSFSSSRTYIHLFVLMLQSFKFIFKKSIAVRDFRIYMICVP